MASITDRTVLIVGASSEIGAEVVRRLGQGGNRLVVTARRAPELAVLAKDIRAAGSACLDIAADALDPQTAAEVVASAVTEYGSVDVALLNAGQGPDMPQCVWGRCRPGPLHRHRQGDRRPSVRKP